MREKMMPLEFIPYTGTCLTYIFGIGKERSAKSKQGTASTIIVHSHSFSRLT